MDKKTGVVDRSPNYIGLDDLTDYGDGGAAYEVLAQMIDVNPSTRELKIVPRSRQELFEATDVSNSTVERRLETGYNELDILENTAGAEYDDYDDLERVYRLKRGRISDEHLRMIKKRGWFRPRESEYSDNHVNVEGGASDFLNMPNWKEFVDCYLFD